MKGCAVYLAGLFTGIVIVCLAAGAWLALSLAHPPATTPAALAATSTDDIRMTVDQGFINRQAAAMAASQVGGLLVNVNCQSGAQMLVKVQKHITLGPLDLVPGAVIRVHLAVLDNALVAQPTAVEVGGLAVRMDALPSEMTAPLDQALATGTASLNDDLRSHHLALLAVDCDERSLIMSLTTR